MSELIDKVLIVGGGTAGWITAAKLAKELGSSAAEAIQIELIESQDIPTIGVGEGTWPTMRSTLEKLGINEADFMRYCNVSFKQGSRFVNWKETPSNGIDNCYHNHFTSIQNPEIFNLAPYWALGYAGDRPYSEAVSIQGAICANGLAPKKMTSRPYEGIQNYAYHLDAGKFADFLKNFCVEKLGVKHTFGNIKKVLQARDGFIESVETTDGRTIDADFFVDCSGFSALLIGETLAVPFKSISNQLFVDHAIAIQIPYDDEMNDPVATQTISTAQKCGWIWDIGLTNRRGTGHVYSSSHMDHNTAEAILRNYLGPKSKDLVARKLKMNIGCREKFWEKNCVAIGMSAAFIEPLEASAIFLIEAAGNMLADQFPRTREDLLIVEKKFNKSFQFRWKKTIDFIKMHYFLSRRDDSDFWLDNKSPSSVSDELHEKLAHWKSHPPSRYDFDHLFEPFPLESYQYILYGLEFPMNLSNNKTSFNRVNEASKDFEKVQLLASLAQKELPNHRDILNKIKKFDFQSI